MARAGLGMGVRELAASAEVSTNTVTRFERGEELKPRTLRAIQETFERSGVIFSSNPEGTVGVLIPDLERHSLKDTEK